MTSTAQEIASPVLTEEMVREIRALFPRYPSKQAVTLPALHVVHQRLRHVPYQAVVEIAHLLDLAPAQVQDTLSFYGFFHQERPHGEHRAWICRSISCALRGGEELVEHVCKNWGIGPGETTADGKLTVETGECLGACDFAPCMLMDETLYPNLTTDRIDDVLGRLGRPSQTRTQSQESSSTSSGQ